MKTYSYFAIIAFTFLALEACAPRAVVQRRSTQPHKEALHGFRRGLWIRAAAIASPDSIARIVHIAKETHITDIFAQVVVGGYAYYHSALLPRSQYLSRISEAGYDPLDSLIHAFSHTPVRIHAWINTYLYWSLPVPPDSLGHVFYEHPDWFIEDVNRKSIADYSYAQWKDLRLEGLYLDPMNPHVSLFIQDICSEIVSQYAVDGIHLDFVRYPGVLWGLPHTEESAVLAGIDGNKIRYCSTIEYGRSDLYERWQIWHAWRLTNGRQWVIERMINDINKRITANAFNHYIQLSAAVFANPSLARYSFAQNWTAWDPRICQPIVMSYTPDITLFLDYMHFALRNRPEAILGIGLLWPDMDTIARLQEKAARDANAPGVCYFDFTSIDSLADLVSALGDTHELQDMRLDTIQFDVSYDVFTSRPRPEHISKGTVLTDWGIDIDFAAFLLSLSLDPNRDLTRMALSRQDFIELISQDVAAFLYLDRNVFPLADYLIEPPRRAVRYTFVPWLEDDSVVVLEKAQAISEFIVHTQLSPLSTDPFAKAAFSVEPGSREILPTPAGVYVFVVDSLLEGGRLLSREDVPPTAFPIYANWTIRSRFMNLVGED